MIWKLPALAFLALPVSFVARATTGMEDANAFRSLMAESRIGIHPMDVSRSFMAVRLSQVVEEGYKDNIDTVARRYGFDPLNGIYLESGIDAVYLTREDGKYCAASFRGTTSHQVGDWITNFDLEPVTFGAALRQQQQQSAGDKNITMYNATGLQKCDVHSGYHQAYANFEFRDAVESFLGTCRSECAGCETILTGHSQGGGIAAIAALYMKFGTFNGINTRSNESVSYNSPYVITFAAPQSLGAGCDPLISDNERTRWFRYIVAREQEIGDNLVYDPIPLLYAQLLDPPEEENQSGSEYGFWDNFGGFFEIDIDTDETYARNGGLAYIGHEILLSTGDPSSILLSDFDGHRFVDIDYMDLTGKAHQDYIYAGVLEAQDEIYNRRNTTEDCFRGGKFAHKAQILEAAKKNSSIDCPEHFLPSTGFVVGSLCNPGEDKLSSTCADGTFCKKEDKRWFWEDSRHSCQPIQLNGNELQTSPPSQVHAPEPSKEDNISENNQARSEITLPQEESMSTLSSVASGACPTRTPDLLRKSWVNGVIPTIALASGVLLDY